MNKFPFLGLTCNVDLPKTFSFSFIAFVASKFFYFPLLPFVFPPHLGRKDLISRKDFN